jgi:hypothetical protein
MEHGEPTLTSEQWKELLHDCSELLDITWHHACNLAASYAKEERRKTGRQRGKRDMKACDEIFKDSKTDAFDRAVRVRDVVRRLAKAAGVRE